MFTERNVAVVWNSIAGKLWCAVLHGYKGSNILKRFDNAVALWEVASWFAAHRSKMHQFNVPMSLDLEN